MMMLTIIIKSKGREALQMRGDSIVFCAICEYKEIEF